MKITAQKRIENWKLRIGNSFFKISNRKSQFPTQKGFTLIEILVATTILATLAGGVLLTLNPIGQINKSQDVQRTSDLQAISTALDLYYHDTGCYPPDPSVDSVKSVPFGNAWRINNTVYMKKVPQDPKCSGTSGTCYHYRSDTNKNNSCPQWGVVFAQLSKNSTLVNACPLSTLSNCTPDGYSQGKYACVMQGAVNCSDLASTSLLTGLETAGGQQAPNPCDAASNRQNDCACTANPQCASNYCDLSVPRHTGTNLCKSQADAFDPNAVIFPLPGDTNPDPTEVSLSPLYASPAAAQTIKLKISDPGVKITSVEVVVSSDGTSKGQPSQHSIFLNPPTGSTNNAGTWTGTRQVGNQETFYNFYTLEFFITAGSGASKIVGYEKLDLINTGK